MTPGSLATATQINFANMVVNGAPAPTGSFFGVPGNTPVTMNTLTFSPFVANNPLWSFVSGPTTFSLDATTVTVQAKNANFLNILGTGTAHGTGFDPTPYFFSITATDASGAGSSISAGVSNSNTVVPVPPSLVMLSSGLIGLAVIRRKV